MGGKESGTWKKLGMKERQSRGDALMKTDAGWENKYKTKPRHHKRHWCRPGKWRTGRLCFLPGFSFWSTLDLEWVFVSHAQTWKNRKGTCRLAGLLHGLPAHQCFSDKVVASAGLNVCLWSPQPRGAMQLMQELTCRSSLFLTLWDNHLIALCQRHYSSMWELPAQWFYFQLMSLSL